jgi:hypothetical protein
MRVELFRIVARLNHPSGRSGQGGLGEILPLFHLCPPLLPVSLQKRLNLGHEGGTYWTLFVPLLPIAQSRGTISVEAATARRYDKRSLAVCLSAQLIHEAHAVSRLSVSFPFSIVVYNLVNIVFMDYYAAPPRNGHGRVGGNTRTRRRPNDEKQR